MRRLKTGDANYVEARLRNVRLEREGRIVLQDVSWTIRPGERWVLAGGNGAGKTQLMKVIAGAVWPSPTPTGSLEYYWKNEVWRTPFEVKEEIGYVGPERQDKYERYGWNHSVEQVVGTGLYRTDIPLNPLTGADRRHIAALLGRLAIRRLTERGFLSLSYGERRLTLLARSLASHPKLLLLDELLNGLDPINHRRAVRWLEETKRSRLPWVLSTHRVEDVPRSATHALVLDRGHVAYSGPVADAPLGRWLHPRATADSGRHAGGGGQSPGRNARPRHSPRRSFLAPGSVSAKRLRRTPGDGALVRLTDASVYLDEHRALDRISFAVLPGNCWVVHGRNGSGKTTLLRTLYGDHGVASGGRIERAGIEPGVPLQIFKQRVGLVAPHVQSEHPQHLTVAEVVQSGRHASIGLNDPPTAADRRCAKRSLEFFGLSDFAGRTLRELSYGQLRRVLFARAWVRQPDLLLLDEPFSGVDGPTRADLLEHVDRMVASGAAVVMATHYRSEWPACTTHELELTHGRTRYCGPVRRTAGVATK